MKERYPNVKGYYVVAEELGAVVAMELALLESDRVKGMMLIDLLIRDLLFCISIFVYLNDRVSFWSFKLKPHLAAALSA